MCPLYIYLQVRVCVEGQKKESAKPMVSWAEQSSSEFAIKSWLDAILCAMFFVKENHLAKAAFSSFIAFRKIERDQTVHSVDACCQFDCAEEEKHLTDGSLFFLIHFLSFTLSLSISLSLSIYLNCMYHCSFMWAVIQTGSTLIVKEFLNRKRSSRPIMVWFQCHAVYCVSLAVAACKKQAGHSMVHVLLI